MKNINLIIFSISILLIVSCNNSQVNDDQFITLSKNNLQDKIKGAWALQAIGVTYGGPTEFHYKTRIIPDSVKILWNDTLMQHLMNNWPGLYDDIYLDLTFVEILEKEGLDAPPMAFGQAYANADYKLWHANQQGRYNILNGMKPPATGHWRNNPHADDIDFQIEADFAGIMNPGMPQSAVEICDRVGHIMNYGDGYYGGVFVAGMYAYAFIENDVPTIVNQALALLPEESTFYQCIADVVLWHQKNPQDWKVNWQLIEDKWGQDIGCPDGVFRDFNIDAKLNAAYVVLGLLYGEGNMGKTMEIATRAGQDSDCNPATAGGVLGTIVGYEAIPDYWKNPMLKVEDMDFASTTTSLQDAYQLSFDHALQQIKAAGGEIKENEVRIKKQPASVVPLEQNFPGYVAGERTTINQEIHYGDSQEFETDFNGAGVVLTGGVKQDNAQSEDNLDDFAFEVDYFIDDELVKTMLLPLSFITRSPELFFRYELPDENHRLKLVIKNPHEKVFLQINDIITYGKNSQSF